MSFLFSAADIETLIDNWEDDDWSEYTENNGNFKTRTSPVKEGTYSGQIVIKDSERGAVGTSMSGLDAYPSKGDKFQYWVRPGGTSSYHATHTGFGVQSTTVSNNTQVLPDNCYVIEVRVGNNFTLEKMDGGSLSELDTVSPSQSVGEEWYRVVVDWQSTITADLYTSGGTKIASVSASDSAYDNGGVCCQVNDTGDSVSVNAYWDAWELI